MRVSTPWIYSPRFDLAAIIGPPVAVTALVLALGHRLETMEAPLWLWVLLVIGIDVSHVYSSLFRTYFDKEEFARRKTLYLVVPIISWLGGVAIYAAAGAGAFWSCVAYFAIYHFVRQQYGFFMLYRRGEGTGTWAYRLDQLVIYLATVYPLVYWHTYPREFQWFDGFDVIQIPSIWPDLILRGVYLAAAAAFLIKEVWKWKSTGSFNAGKVALFLATAAAWSTGIILFNGNLTFTLINIVSHGVPYMALIWIYQYRKRSKTKPAPAYLSFFQLRFVPFYVAALFLLAFFEEGLWDWFVWKEHAQLFGSAYVQLPTLALMLLVPLLTMPQVTHYILDAFIWRVHKKGHEEVRAVIG